MAIPTARRGAEGNKDHLGVVQGLRGVCRKREPPFANIPLNDIAQPWFIDRDFPCVQNRNASPGEPKVRALTPPASAKNDIPSE